MTGTDQPLTVKENDLERALQILQEGGLVGMPTETVYGLAADATDARSIAHIYAAKSRPQFNPLIAHVDSLASAQLQGVFDSRAIALAKRFWPGPLTLVVPVNETATVAELARAGLPTIGLRVPAHPIARELLERFGKPLAAPSANPSGRISPTSAGDVAGAFGAEVSLVVDGGRSRAGIESTILSVLPGEPVRLLRPGAIPRESILEVVDALAEAVAGEVSAPGQLSSHYAPSAVVRLNAATPRRGEVWLGFGPACRTADANLSSSGDLVEAAANLYQMLRMLDTAGAATIAVAPIPSTGLGEAINDRLARAAAPRR
ncbi:MAG: L-threonylcarbamoyladenylate synthase [Pseudomonadota bacterium]